MCSSRKSWFDPKALCLDSRFVFVLAWFPKYGYPGPCFQTHSTKIPDLWWQIMIKHSYFSCFHTHVLHVHQQRETQSFPTSFPCMWPSGTHLGKEVWNLGLDLVGAQHVFRKHLCIWETCLKAHSIGFAMCCRTWACLDPDVWRNDVSGIFNKAMLHLLS